MFPGFRTGKGDMEPCGLSELTRWNWESMEAKETRILGWVPKRTETQ